MYIPQSIEIREVGPRDGLQNEAPIPVSERIRLIDSLSKTGLRRIEVTSFVRPDKVPQMAGAEDVWAGIEKANGVIYSALVLNEKGAKRALEAGFSHLQFVVSASETHNKKNAGRSREESIEELSKVVSSATQIGADVEVTISTAWGCPYEGDVKPSEVVRLVRRCVEVGVQGVSLGDTTGMATPRRVWDLAHEVRSVLGTDEVTALNFHFHDTRGTGLANVLGAMDAGERYFDASIGGLGGCPYAPGAAGNIATEGLVYMAHDMGVETGVDLDSLLEVARLAQEIAGRELPSAVLKAGPRWKKK
ncbi:MAG: hydroxymethylglutaryl-CoA lyase [Acidimicrobiia bacterium]